MNFKAAIFDLDGTLLDTLEDLADSANAVLARHDFPIHDVSAYRYFVGNGVRKLVSRAAGLGEEGRGELFETLLVEMREEYGRRWDNKTHPYDGIEVMLEKINAAGLQLAVLSNKPHPYTVLCVERFLEHVPWAHVQGVNEDCPPKPEPTGALRLALQLGVEPDEVIYLGDTNTDMETACNAGFFAVGVTWGFRDEAELRKSGAKAIIHAPLELIDLL